jgi:rRNA processing protein Gar1
MKSLGIIKNITREGQLLLKTTKSVKIGTEIYDAKGRRIGKVSRVFGPVKGPYMTLDGCIDSTAQLKLLNSAVYFDTEGSTSKKKRG